MFMSASNYHGMPTTEWLHEQISKAFKKTAKKPDPRALNKELTKIGWALINDGHLIGDYNKAYNELKVKIHEQNAAARERLIAFKNSKASEKVAK